MEPAHEERNGTIAGAVAFLVWGMLPIYWKTLDHVAAGEILAHRIVWSVVWAVAVLAATRRWHEFTSVLRRPKEALRVLAATILISINWLTFLWAVTHDHMVDGSLGYFLTPLLNVLLGMVFLGERPRRGQAVAMILALTALATLILVERQLPWVAVSLAVSFSLVGLLRKTTGVEALPGFALETTFALPFALGYLLWLGPSSLGSWGHLDGTTRLLLALTGLATAVPTILFTYAARRVRLATVGFLQYLAPTGMFVLGVALYGEPIGRMQLLSFALIWCALGIYSWDSLRGMRMPGRLVSRQ